MSKTQITMFIPKPYKEVLENRHFFILILTLLLGQVASAFLLVALIASVFTTTGSNFAVSGIILSLSTPSFLLMAFAGLIADLVDRKKLIILANALIALVVLAALFVLGKVFASISLSFLYFAGNTFFLPAVSAATSQLVKRSQLTVANSLFVLTLAGGQIIGFFVAAIILFFFGSLITLVVCELILAICVFLPMLLPKLEPRGEKLLSVFLVIKDIGRSFIYIFSSKAIWFFFTTFALMQGIVAFGATLAPGFFDEIVGLSIDKSPIVIFPAVALGIILGAFFVHNPKVSGSYFISLGLGVVGVLATVLGLTVKYQLIKNILIFLPLLVFMIGASFGVIVSMIASRTYLQKRVEHKYQGTVFGANMILASFFASVLSPTAAGLEALFGYVNVVLFAGLIFAALALLIAHVGNKWKF